MAVAQDERTPPLTITLEQLMENFQLAGQEIVRSAISEVQPKPEAPPTPAEPTPEADVEQAALTGIIRQLDTIGGLDVPFGSVIFGGIPGLVVGELVDGFVSPVAAGGVSWANVLVKTGVAWMGVQFLPQFIGRNGSLFFAGSLALQAARQILPIDQWVANLVGMFPRGAAGMRRGSIVAQAESVAHAYQRQVVGTHGVYKGVI